MALTQIDVVFLMPVGIKVVWSNSIHMILLVIDYNFHLLKALTLYITNTSIFYYINVEV